MSILENVTDLNAMIMAGDILGAFDKYYADDVQMRENDQEPRVGKAACRAYEEYFVANLQGFHGAEIRAVAIGEGVSMVNMWMDITFQNQRMSRNQVAVQHWKDGKIVNEQFFYAG
jgi:SnoaL-like domain